MVVKVRKNYTDSLAHCKSLGGALALPESAEESLQINHKIGKRVRSCCLIFLFPSFSPLIIHARDSCELLTSPLAQLALFRLSSSPPFFFSAYYLKSVPELSHSMKFWILVSSGTSQNYFHIGMSDQIAEGVWKTTESNHRCDVHFTDWRPGQPNNAGNEDCVVIDKSSGGKWVDNRCSHSSYFVCQILE